MTITIETGIAVPRPPQAFLRKYPFPDMQVGDSFFIPAKTADRIRTRNRVRVAARRHALRRDTPKGWRFATRVVEGGIRCWRIS